MLAEEVTEEDVAEVVAKWTGIPVSRLMEGEVEKLIQMEERLHERVIGQDEAIAAVSNALRRSRAGLSDPNRPIGSLPLPRPDRGRQDRAGEGAGRVHVRLRAGDRPPRHVRVHGEAHGGAADRRAARLRRLRGGRPADRGGAAPALRGGAARRDREGPPRRLQHAAADHGRRPAHRRPGPHGQLHQHGPDHDLERRQRPDRRRVGRREDPRADRRGAGGDLQARVPQPDRRHGDLPPPLEGRTSAASSSCRSTSWSAGCASAGSRSS